MYKPVSAYKPGSAYKLSSVYKPGGVYTPPGIGRLDHLIWMVSIQIMLQSLCQRSPHFWMVSKRDRSVTHTCLPKKDAREVDARFSRSK
jgi:hypothetical protein